MAASQDPWLTDGPLPPPAPRDPNAKTVLDPIERGEDVAREGTMGELLDTPARPLSDDEKEAARADAGRQPRTYAPASERVPKAPAPGDRELIEEGERHAPSPEVLAEHPGDRSDPSEMR